MNSSTQTSLLCSLGLLLCLGGSSLGGSSQGGSKRADHMDPLAVTVDRLAQDLNSLRSQMEAQSNDMRSQLEAQRNQMNVQRQLIDTQAQEIADLKAVNNRTVAFSAYMSDEPNVQASQGSTIPFRGIITNTRGAYNSATSVFTAPVPGNYFFLVHADCSPDYRYIILSVNGQHLFYTANDGRDYHVMGSGLVALQAGDVVNTQHITNTGYVDAGLETTFTGFLVR